MQKTYYGIFPSVNCHFIVLILHFAIKYTILLPVREALSFQPITCLASLKLAHRTMLAHVAS